MSSTTAKASLLSGWNLLKYVRKACHFTRSTNQTRTAAVNNSSAALSTASSAALSTASSTAPSTKKPTMSAWTTTAVTPPIPTTPKFSHRAAFDAIGTPNDPGPNIANLYLFTGLFPHTEGDLMSSKSLSTSTDSLSVSDQLTLNTAAHSAYQKTNGLVSDRTKEIEAIPAIKKAEQEIALGSTKSIENLLALYKKLPNSIEHSEKIRFWNDVQNKLDANTKLFQINQRSIFTDKELSNPNATNQFTDRRDIMVTFIEISRAIHTVRDTQFQSDEHKDKWHQWFTTIQQPRKDLPGGVWKERTAYADRIEQDGYLQV